MNAWCHTSHYLHNKCHPAQQTVTSELTYPSRAKFPPNLFAFTWVTLTPTTHDPKSCAPFLNKLNKLTKQ